MRMTPMAEDENDKRAARDMIREMGSAKFGASVPFFFTRYGMPVDIIGHWYGAACFLVSNGPSLLKLDLDQLKRPGIMTMTLNNGAATLLQRGITPNFWTCVDQPSRFIRQIWLNPAILKLVPTATLDKPLWDNETWKPLDQDGVKFPRDCPNILGFRRNEKFAAHRFFTESSINWGCHKRFGGCRTVLLPGIRIPYLLGFRRLYLLGVDLKMDEAAKYHFSEGRTQSAIKGNGSTYNRIITEYGPGVRKHADQLGYKIYNCNPDSALTCFEQANFAEAVEREAGFCGPTAKIATEGMYVEWDKKVTMTREQAMAATGAAS